MAYPAIPMTCSVVIQTRLAAGANQPSPRQDNAFAYIDACLTNTGEREEKTKADLIARLGAEQAQRSMLESRLDVKLERTESRFDRLDVKLERTESRFDKAMSKLAAVVVDGVKDAIGVRVDQLHNRLKDQEKDWIDHWGSLTRLCLDSTRAHENAEALFRNGLIRRLHQKIIPILVRRPSKQGFGDYEWQCHQQMPKTAVEVYALAQRAKGILVSNRDRRELAANPEYEHQAQENARGLIKSLCVFYQVDPREERYSETDGLEVWLDENSVDQHMTELLERWGMRWDKLCTLGDRAGKSQPPQAGHKRSETAGSGKEAKKARDSNTLD